MYRPHFAYATPANCEDQECEYYYDSSDVGAMSVSSLGSVFGMILGPFDKDAPFHWRGWRVSYNGTDNGLGIQFRDPDGQLLSDATINLKLYALGSGFSGFFRGGMAVPLDDEIICPTGSVIEVNWSRELNSASSVPPFPGISLLGIKRYSGVRR